MLADGQKCDQLCRWRRLGVTVSPIWTRPAEYWIVIVLRMVYNSKWLGQLTFEDVVRLAGRTTVAQLLARSDFSARYQKDEPIGLHEFLYPLAQAQDSVEINADVELGGTDQKFNLLMGRTLQKSVGQQSQVCIMLPILEGLDGVEKMSKSLDNYVGITEPADSMYGKLLSMPDELIYRYFELASDVETHRLSELAEQCRTNPRDAKHFLAYRLVSMYHGTQAADAAKAHIEKTLIRKEVPDNIADFRPMADGQIGLLDLLTQAGPHGVQWCGAAPDCAGGRPNRRATGN